MVRPKLILGAPRAAVKPAMIRVVVQDLPVPNIPEEAPAPAILLTLKKQQHPARAQAHDNCQHQ